MIVAVYADGGVITQNPSPLGGSWAYCLVDEHDKRVAQESGIITPVEAQVDVVSNNLTELLALIRGLEALPERWRGTVYSDSQISLRRLFDGWKLAHVPMWLVQRGTSALQRLDLPNVRYVHLDGHPTREQLQVGRGKRGNPVSAHNVWCDSACTARAHEFLKALKRAAA